MNETLSGAYATDAGMLALWDPQHFVSITDYDTWEKELLEDEDILRHVQVGSYVPLYIHADGVYGCEVRVGTSEAPAVLSEREQTYLTVTSQPYLFRSRGEACVSGIEQVESEPGESEPGESVGRLNLPSGDYAVTVYLLAWNEEPGAMDPNQHPMPHALPDFLILLNPVTGSETFRVKVDTFDPPEA